MTTRSSALSASARSSGRVLRTVVSDSGPLRLVGAAVRALGRVGVRLLGLLSERDDSYGLLPSTRVGLVSPEGE